MGKVKAPKRLLVDARLASAPSWERMRAQGHTIEFQDFSGYDLVVSQIAQMCPDSRVEYVELKYKDIVKEVAK